MMQGVTGAILGTLVPLQWLGKKVVAIFDERFPELLSPVEYCTTLKKELDQRGALYFGGGTKPGALDASAYGILCVFVSGDMEFAKEALTKSGLLDWYERISKEIPDVLKKEGKWPFYT